MTFYNDTDRHAAAWLRALIDGAHITGGIVDERPIQQLTGADLAGYERVHLFAGIAGWDYALRLAGWSGPVWTGSCPCQPFSSAGRGGGASDERHLWPAFYRLIEECRPPVVFGEQVASKAGRAWLAGVRADLESLGYAVGCADLCAASVGAPHIRQRLYWVADTDEAGREGQWGASGHNGRAALAGRGEAGGMGDAEGTGREADASRFSMLHQQQGEGCAILGTRLLDGPMRSGAANWSRYDLIPCRDGKSRRVESGTFPLAHGLPARVGRLRGYGNAIVPQVAAEFVKAYMESVTA